jgi:cellulose synthase/poly-beta-1,6-N-acetylglucosamine synthase-like glycosyltransferase
MYHNNIFLFLVFGAFSLSAAIQIFYYLWFYLAIHTYKPGAAENIKNPVSVIICARNEAENLRKFLPFVLEQDYPDYEVIVVNDCSEDSSYEVLAEYILKYPHLKVSSVNKDPKFAHSKKFAQFIGIKAARNDILLFTDADCQPESKQWIERMTSHFDERTDFVLGFGGYLKGKNLLNKYIHYDSMTIAMQYLGMAIRGIPYMGVGRNLAYRRSVFFENKGFGSHTQLISGDDDLFVNANAGRKNTSVEFSRESHTRSVPAVNAGEWFIQKKRHLTTAVYYKPRDKFILFLEPLTRIIFYFSLIILLSRLFLWLYVLIIFGLRLITQIVTLILAGKKLNERGLTGYSMIFDIFSPLLNGAVFLSNLQKRSVKNQWK